MQPCCVYCGCFLLAPLTLQEGMRHVEQTEVYCGTSRFLKTSDVLDLSSQFFIEHIFPVLAFMHSCAYVKHSFILLNSLHTVSRAAGPVFL